MTATASGWVGRVTRHVPLLQRMWSRLHARLMKATGGRFLPRWFGMPVLVIEVVGRRSGELRRAPVIYMEDEGGWIVIAAAGGSDRVPAWWLNLEAASEATITIGGTRHDVVPVLLEGDERRRVWREFAKQFPALDEYTEITDRRFPVVRLQPR